jgi:hypothetical protein
MQAQQGQDPGLRTTGEKGSDEPDWSFVKENVFVMVQVLVTVPYRFRC